MLQKLMGGDNGIAEEVKQTDSQSKTDNEIELLERTIHKFEDEDKKP